MKSQSTSTISASSPGEPRQHQGPVRQGHDPTRDPQTAADVDGDTRQAPHCRACAGEPRRQPLRDFRGEQRG